MVQNGSVLTTVEHSSQVCHLSCRSEQSVIFHIGWHTVKFWKLTVFMSTDKVLLLYCPKM